MTAILLGILIIGGMGLFAGGGVVLARKFVQHDVREGHNDVLVPLFLTAGVIYAVLIGFMVVAVWETYDAAHATVSEEATTLVPAYRLTNGMSQKHGDEARAQIRDYAHRVIEEEWKTLSTEHPGSSHARKDIGDLFRGYANLDPAVLAAHSQINAEFLRTVSGIVAARNKRLMEASEGLPPIMWFGSIGGGVIVIGMSFILYMDRRWPQVMMTTVLGLLIGTLLFIMVLLNRPFAGPLALTAEPFEATLKVFDDIDRGN